MIKTICIIPARSGSKGIPQKNLRILAGHPLIGRAIMSAQKATSINRVCVSTDSEQIGRVAVEYGAEVINRPEEISNDTASSELVLLHGLDYLAEKENYEPDVLVLLQCTAPLVTHDEIEGTIQSLLSSDADSALAVTGFHYFIWCLDRDGNAVGVNHDKTVRLMRQQRQEQFLETGSVYVMKVQGFKQARHRFFGKTVMHVIPQEHSLEIDDPVDLVKAEAILEGLAK